MAITSSVTPESTVCAEPHADAAAVAADRAPTRGHIGRIVAGSIIGGLVGAVVVVVGPFAGAQEHVITGSVLLVFAAAWATLAVLSERWTDQPQRWAFVPAALMGVTGLSILVFAPTGNEPGWVWPPVAAALAVWMVVRARRDLRSRTRTWLLYPVSGALLLSAVGGGYEMYRETADTNYPMPGRLVDVGGHKLHINCTGTGSPTVVLEPGLGEPSTAMAWIAPDVAATTRVCIYDRAGRGWSESAGAPQDGVQVATDLHTLLDRAGEHGPYVLAGHSAGGLYVLNFAQLYPDQVAGVALLDSMTPEQYTAIDGWPAFYEMYRRASAVLTPLSRLGVGHLIYDSAFGDLPGPARDQARAFMATPRAARSVRDEFSQIRTTMTEAQALTTLGDRPLIVLTAGKGAQGGWMAAQDELAALSTDTVHRTLENAEHDGSDAAGVFQGLCIEQSHPASNVEHLDAPTAFAEVATINSLSEFPMIVATADHHSYAGLAAGEEARLNDVWNAGQARWVSLVASAQLISVDNTSHNIQLDRPDVVLDMIHELLR